MPSSIAIRHPSVLFQVIPFSEDPLKYTLKWAPKPGAIPQNRTIILASPKGGCGKTSLKIFLASELARLGAKVLLVESTEGQAPLTQSFAFGSLDSGKGLGLHLQRLIGLPRIGESYSQICTRLHTAALKEAKEALESNTLVRVGVSPEDPLLGFDFLPCGEQNLAELATSPKMQDRAVRRGVFSAFFKGLAELHGGWDFILIDVLPSAESVIVKGAMGVADAYALVVDMESAKPLPGWGILMQELTAIQEDRAAEGRTEEIFKGLILNKVKVDRPGMTRKVNRLMVRLKQAQAAAQGIEVPILAEVRNMSTLAILGFNCRAVKQLAEGYGGSIPSDLDNLSEQDVERLICFEAGVDKEGNDLGVVTGIPWLAKMFPSLRNTLEDEARDLHPLLLNLAGDMDALAQLREAYLAIAQ